MRGLDTSRFIEKFLVVKSRGGLQDWRSAWGRKGTGEVRRERKYLGWRNQISEEVGQAKRCGPAKVGRAMRVRRVGLKGRVLLG